MSTSDRKYHHGDLRRALVTAGLQCVADVPVDSLSLRELARRVGVSPSAVYRHFPDRAALMSALAAEGLAMLGNAQRAAFAAAGGDRAGFAATGVAYVRFALANPSLFRLIFQHPAPAGLVSQEEGAPDAMGFLLANARALAPARVDAQIFAIQAWSLAHGLAMLLLDCQLPIDAPMIQAVIDTHLKVGRD